jgi:hypothetical protein
MQPIELAQHAYTTLASLLQGQPPATREAHYATFSLLAIDELIEGALAELAAGRLHNAARLVRHAWEFETELTWVMADPGPRVDRWRMNEARRAHLLAGDEPLKSDDWLGHVLAKDYEQARQAPNSFLPSVQAMAMDLGREDWYRDEYRPLSYIAHPGLRGTAAYSAATKSDHERALRGEAVLGDVPVGRQPPDRDKVEHLALLLTLVIARTLEPAGKALGVWLGPQARSIMEPFTALAAGRDDVIAAN